jgi:hypothetical protein
MTFIKLEGPKGEVVKVCIDDKHLKLEQETMVRVLRGLAAANKALARGNR